jgi:2-haloacid dehalogenase
MNIDTIIFDFGGVLIDWNPRYLYKSIFNDDEKMEWFLANICTNDWNLEQDRGRSFKEATEALALKYPEWREVIFAYHHSWDQMLMGEIPGSVEILKLLKQQYPVYGLTNWSEETFPIALQRFDFLQLFDGIVVSGTEKFIKPDKQIFQCLLDRYHLKAESSVFIDDNLLNINAAKNMGFYTIHFTTPEDLRTQLEKLEVF